MISKSTVIWLGLAGLASGALFHTSYQVQALDEDLAGLDNARSFRNRKRFRS